MRCLVLVLMFFAVLQAQAQAPPRIPTGVAPGDVVPEIAGPMLAGEPLRLSQLRGKVVLVDFWASYCGIAMPEIDRLRDELHALGYADRFEVLGVTVDQDTAKAEAFLKRTPVRYPIISDLLNVASQRFGVWRLPATYLLDPEGRAFRIYHGFGDSFVADIRHHALYLLDQPEAGAGAVSTRAP
jgi:peroxiredoxin